MSIDLSKYIDTHGAANGRSYNGAMMDKGKFAETTILKWLRDFPDVLEVEDYRSLRAMQRTDVDCGICFVEGDIILAELKSDKYLKMGGNVVFEYLRINHTAPPDRACVLGWTARTPAKWVLYYTPLEQSVYRFKTEVLRNVFQEFTRAMRPEYGEWFHALPQMNMRWVSTDNIKSTLVACIPLSRFPKSTDALRIFDVSDYI